MQTKKWGQHPGKTCPLHLFIFIPLLYVLLLGSLTALFTVWSSPSLYLALLRHGRWRRRLPRQDLCQAGLGLTGHWVPWNREGMCTLPDCWGKTASHKGTVTFFLLSCPSLTFTRISMNLFNASFLLADPHLIQLVKECLVIDPVQFWLACSTMAPVTVGG